MFIFILQNFFPTSQKEKKIKETASERLIKHSNSLSPSEKEKMLPLKAQYLRWKPLCLTQKERKKDYIYFKNFISIGNSPMCHVCKFIHLNKTAMGQQPI